MGIPVIWTCQEDWFNKDHEDIIYAKTMADEPIQVKLNNKREIHFDISHYNFIIWKDGDDLYTRLKNRISATIK